MTTYRITAPNGRDYEIDGPAGATQEQVRAAVMPQFEADQQLESDSRTALANAPDPGLGENILSGLGSGFTGTLESGALGIATLLDEENELGAREIIQGIGDKFTPDGGDKDSISYGLANAIGSIGGFAAPAAAAALAAPAALTTAVGTGVAAGLGVATQAGEASERARDAGTTEDIRNKAIMTAAPIGLTEVLPLGKLSAFMKVPIFKDLLGQLGPKTLTGIRGRIASAASTGGLEAAQEVAQELTQNLVEQGYYNPSKELMDNLGPAAGYGGGAGAIVQGMVDLFAGRRFREARAGNKPTAEDQEADALVDQLDIFGDEAGPVPGQNDLFGDEVAEPTVVPTVDETQGDLFDNLVDPRQLGLIDEPDVTKEGEVDWETAPSGSQADLFSGSTESFVQQLEDLLGDPQQAEELIAQLKAAKNREQGKPPTQLDVVEEAQLEADIEAENTAILDAKAKKEAEAEQQVQESELESTDARVKNRQIKQTEGVRRVILDNVISSNESNSYNYIDVVKAFTEKLEIAKLAKNTPTNEELERIHKAVGLQFPKAKVAPTQVPPTGGAKELESLIPEKLQKVTQPEQLTLPEVEGKNRAGKKYPAQTAVSEQQAAAEPISPATLTELGVAKAAPMRGRVAADPTNLELVKQELTDYANNPKVPEQTKFKITKYLEGEASDQIEAFGPRGGVVAPAKKVTQNEQRATVDEAGNRGGNADTAPVEGTPPASDVKPAVVAQTEEPATGSVELSGESTVPVGDGAGGTDTALETDTAAKTKPKKTVAPTEDEVAAEIKKATGEQKLYGPEEVAAAVEIAKSSPEAMVEAIKSGFASVIASQTETATEPKATKPKTKKEQREASTEKLLEEAKPKPLAEEGFGAKNKGVTKDAAQAALERIRKSSKTPTSGVDPARLADAVILAGFYIEGGARSFADYSAKMVEAMGESIRPYLGLAYKEVLDTTENTEGMNTAAEVDDDITPEDRATVDAMTTAQKKKVSVAGEASTEYTKNMGLNPYLSENPKELVPVSDYTTIIKLLQTPDSKLDEVGKATKTYFNDDRRVIDNLTDIAYDSSHRIKLGGTTGVRVSKYNIPSAMLVYAGKVEADTTQENAFMNQKGGIAADNALQWVRDNLGKKAVSIVNKKWSAHLQEYVTVLKLDPITYMSKIEQRKFDKTDAGKAAIAKKEAIAAEKAMNAVIAGMPVRGEIEDGPVTTPQTFEAGDQAAIDRKTKVNKKQKSAKEAEQELVDTVREQSEQEFGELVDLVDEGLTKEDKVDKARDDYIDLIESGKATKKQLKKAFADLNGLLEMPYYAIDATHFSMHPKVRVLLAAGDLKGAMELVANTNPNKMVRRTASAISKKIGDTKIKMVKGLKNPSGRPAGGHFDPKTNTISINAKAGVPTHVLLHESAHAVLSHTIADNPSNPAVKQLETLYESVKDDLSSHYGSDSLQEFVAEVLSNPQFQQELASLYASRKSNKTALQQFKDTFLNFLKKVLGIQSTGTQGQLNDLLLGLMSPAPATRNAGELNSQAMMGMEESVSEIVAAIKEGRAINKAAMPKLKKSDFATTAKQLFFHDLPSNLRLAATGLFPAYHLADLTKALGVDGSHKLYHSFNAYDGAVDDVNQMTDTFTNEFNDWRGNATPEQVLLFDKLRAWTTREGVHPAKVYKTDAKGKFILDKDGNKQKLYKGRKLEQWKKMQEPWKLLGKDGQAQYESMRNQYVEAYERLKQNLLEAIEAVTEGQPALGASLQGKVFKDLLEGTDIDPYFPLWRKGKYWVQYSADLDGQNETVYEIFPDADSQQARFRELKAIQDGDAKNNPMKIGDTNPVEQYESSNFKSFDKVPPTAFVKESMDVLDKMEVDEATKEMFVQLFIDRLPETSFAKKVQARTGDYGFELDSLETFRNTIYSLNRQTMQLKYGRQIRKNFADFDENVTLYNKANPEDLGKREVVKDLRREWELRSDFAVNPDSDWKATTARNVNRFAFTGTIGFSFSSAMVNLSQIPMVVYPYLAGKTDLTTAMKSLNKARHLLFNAGREHQVQIEGADGKLVNKTSFAPSIDNYFLADPETGLLSIREDFELSQEGRKELEVILPMVQFMKNNAQLSRSLFYDTLGVELSGTSKTILDKATAYSAWLFHITERTNRQIAMVGAYFNEIERLTNNPNTELRDADGKQIEVGLSKAEIQELAVINGFKDAQYTNGGSVLATAPRWAQKNIGRVAMMFKSYGVTMYLLQAKTFRQMIKGQSKYERHQAAKQFFGTMGTVSLMSGLQGLTIYGMVAMVANMFLDDDEEDFETITRKYMGEGIYKGGLNQITRVLGGEGVDIAARIGLSNLLIGSDRYNFDPSLEKTLVKTLGGPAYGYGSQVGRGIGDIWSGEYWRGVENILPAAFRNVMKAARYTDDGEIRSRRGDPIMGELGGGLLAAQVLGFAPAEYTRNQERAQSLKGIDRPANERRTKLLWLLYRAERFGDDTTGIMDDIYEFNDKHPDNAIDGKSIANSRKRHMKTDQKMINGVLLSPNMEARLRDMHSDWDRGFQGF